MIINLKPSLNAFKRPLISNLRLVFSEFMVQTKSREKARDFSRSPISESGKPAEPHKHPNHSNDSKILWPLEQGSQDAWWPYVSLDPPGGTWGIWGIWGNWVATLSFSAWWAFVCECNQQELFVRDFNFQKPRSWTSAYGTCTCVWLKMSWYSNPRVLFIFPKGPEAFRQGI
jgi:hypothetical protein